MKPQITKTFRVQRWHGGGTGCHGSESLYDVDGDGAIGHRGLPSAGYLLGRDLPDGTVVRVTVEVLKEGEGWGVGPHPSHYWWKGTAHTNDCSPKEAQRADA